MSISHWLAGRMALVGCAALGLALAGPAEADPAKIAPGSNSAERAFGKFAGSWMKTMEQREATNRGKPEIKRYAGRTYAAYTGYGSDWDIEVHATGDSVSPYVGVLHYKEQHFTCADETTNKCSVASQTPVTEVFPYRNGKWKY